jgi:streptogramin lyase
MKLHHPRLRLRLAALLPALGACLLAACTSMNIAPPATRPAGWAAPETLVQPSAFHGVHGLAVDAKGRLLAGTVTGNDMWVVDRQNGAARVFIPAPQGQADDIAIGPKGELAWTSYLQGVLRYRENDEAPIRELATGLPGINSLAFDPKNGKLYASQVFLADALWEIDVAGKAPPRAIAKGMGGFNGFEVGPDGQLYGPLWFKGQVVKINPATGAVTVINGEFKTPAAANLDGQGNLWVVDTQTGELCKVELANGRKTVFKQLNSALDNLAIAMEGTIYVSNMADNSVQAVNPQTGEVRTLTSGRLAVPSGVKLDGNTLYVADVFAFRAVDARTGETTDVYRMHAEGSKMEYPFAVGIGGKRIALASWFTGTVQLLDRATRRHVDMLHGFKAPYDALPMDDGSVLVAEIATGSVVRASGEHHQTRTVLAQGLAGPVQMVLGRDGALYVTEAAGKLTRVDLASGSKTTVAEGLLLPEGVAPTPWGSFIVAEAAARRLTEIDPASGARRTVAENLPIGLEGGPGMPPPYAATGVAVGPDGTVYVSADRNNALLRIRPQR